MSLLDPDITPTTVPAAFFIHFEPAYHRGQAAVDRHLEFFEHTGMDVVKVQYEDRFPHRPEIRHAADWPGLPVYDIGFYANQLAILEGVLAAAPEDTLVLQTLYSPFMQASTTTGRDVLRAHAGEDPGAVAAGMARIVESMLAFVDACVRLGVDGFYASTQGADSSMFGGSDLFERCVKPYDLALMNEIARRCRFNILHVCDFHGGYPDLHPVAAYPGHVVSLPGSVELEGRDWAHHAAPFSRPIMGGLDRHGIIASGDEDAIADAVGAVLAVAPERFFLGADCTLPADVSWDRIRVAVQAAHEHRR